jgi:hypothetical protein
MKIKFIITLILTILFSPAWAVSGLKNNINDLPLISSLAGEVHALGNENNPGVLPPYSYPFGKSYGDWSAEWWKWIISIPADNQHPFNNPDWDCGPSQQSGKVWYLVGAFTAVWPPLPPNKGGKIFTCEVPTGKAIFFPVINSECSNVEGVEGDPWYAGNETDARQCAEKFNSGPVSYAVDLKVIVDGKSVKNVERYRFQSPYFTFKLPQPNILGVADAKGKALSDGYWIMLAPLSKGLHTVTFRGRQVSDENDPDNTTVFASDVTYNLTVIGGGDH